MANAWASPGSASPLSTGRQVAGGKPETSTGTTPTTSTAPWATGDQPFGDTV
jgi:hypothetical protein